MKPLFFNNLFKGLFILAILTVGALSASAAEDIASLKRQAEAGHAMAQFNLGTCYSKGDGVPKDMVEAARWWRKAAEQGDAYAQGDLGNCYRLGAGVPEDAAEAAKWYRKGAEQGDGMCQSNLGAAYYFGNGVPRDMAEAVKWYRKAAQQENPAGQLGLGICYFKGEGVPKDEVESFAWYNLVTASNIEGAKKTAEYNCAVIERRLGPRLTLQAQQRAKELLKGIKERKSGGSLLK